MPKKVQVTILLCSFHVSKVMFKILQVSLPSYMNQEFPDVQAGFRKGREERERYIQLDAEFQKIAGRDKKAFLSKQCKGIEENNRMGRTRNLFKKIRYQGNISCKDGHDKGQKW